MRTKIAQKNGETLAIQTKLRSSPHMKYSPEWNINLSIFIRHDKYKVGNKNKNKLKSAKRFRNNHRQCSTDKS